MTPTIKDSPGMNSPGKPGAPSQNSENKAGQSPRSNPVCLEVNVTIRSLPNEARRLTQPIREEGKTVIVFDNGAVLRSTNNLPVGLTVILSNPNGRDVVCRVVGGRNLPSVKGYVEVEFMEPVNDFWNIHQDATPAPCFFCGAIGRLRLPLEKSQRRRPPRAALVLSAAISKGAGEARDCVSGESVQHSKICREPASMSSSCRDSRIENRDRRGLASEPINKEASDYNLSEIAKPTSLANWIPTPAELPRRSLRWPRMRDHRRRLPRPRRAISSAKA